MAGDGLAQHIRQAVGPGEDRLSGEVAFDIACEFTGGLVASVAVLGECSENDRLDFGGDGPVERTRALRRGLGDRRKYLARRPLDGVREPGGQHLVQDDAQRVDVGADIDARGDALGLLG